MSKRLNTVLNGSKNGVLTAAKASAKTGAKASAKTGTKTGSRAKKPANTIGFGCLDTTDPHHFVVTIPKERNQPVLISEHFGLTGEANGLPEKLDRVKLSRAQWKLIAEDVKSVFNERLRDLGYKTSRWKTGENRVDRLLGKELAVLVWAIELADTALVPIAIKNWIGLKPEERWWLFTMTAAATGRVTDGEKGWRKALRYALTENPTEALSRDDMWAAQSNGHTDLPLFELED